MVLLFLFIAMCVDAQEPGVQDPDVQEPGVQNPDSVFLPESMSVISADTLDFIDPDTIEHSPLRAIMYALVLPGLGQGYNRKYYKIPIVYAALGGVGYAIYYNNTNYKQASLDYATDPSDLNERYLRAWRRNLELSYIGLIAVYALQVVDAFVDAQLYSWDVSDNLAIRVQPAIEPLFLPYNLPVSTYGLTCRFSFKGDK